MAHPVISYDQAKEYWVQAGGNPQAADMAAAVSDATTGLNPNYKVTALDGQPIVGLWGILNGSNDPVANARQAVQQSKNGQDWSLWPTAWSDNAGGVNGGTYLGDGSNVLGALGQTGAYNVIGSAPTGAGTSASGATTSTGTSGKTNLFLIVVIGIVLIAAVYYLAHRSQGEQGPAEESQARSQRGWSPEEEAAILDSAQSDKQISATTGRSIRAIRVRRNQIKGR